MLKSKERRIRREKSFIGKEFNTHVSLFIDTVNDDIEKIMNSGPGHLIDEFIKTAYITKVPSAVLAAALMLNAFLMFSVGIILDAIKNEKRYLFECHMNDVMSKYKED